jgi:hypothetical protein
VGAPRGGGRPGGGSRLPGSTPWPGAGGGIGFPYRNEAFEAETTIVWMSALPVRQAMERIGVREELRDVQAAEHYVVLVDGLPPAMAHLAERPEVFRNSARLERKDGQAIRASRVDVEPRPGAPGIELYFPRDASISAGDKYLEVVITTDDYVIRRKFKPAEMVYRGRLEM